MTLLERQKVVLVQDHFMLAMRPWLCVILTEKGNICLSGLVDVEKKNHLLKWIHENKQCYW